jgi:CRP/FNR family transcriptional regulator
MTVPKDIFRQIKHFPESKLQEEIMRHCELKTFHKNDVVVREGEFVKVVPIVISGQIRVYQTKEDRQILLYYVEPTQTCMMSLSACFFNLHSPSQAVAMETTEALIVPARFISEWQKEYTSWNEFVIRTFKNRYDELLAIFESVAFDQIDKRLWTSYKKRRLQVRCICK